MARWTQLTSYKISVSYSFVRFEFDYSLSCQGNDSNKRLKCENTAIFYVDGGNANKLSIELVIDCFEMRLSTE